MESRKAAAVLGQVTIIVQEAAAIRMPTGISSLDPVLEGGIPPGSMILLLGDVGAGAQEFVYSSIANLVGLEKTEAGNASVVLPKEILYITFTRMKDDVMNEITRSFHPDLLAGLTDRLRVVDLSESYFDASVVPHDWYSSTDIVSRLHERSDRQALLARLSKILGESAEGSLLIFDSITDIATQCAGSGHWQNLAGFLRGVQRISKRWRSTSYLLMTRGILNIAQENELGDIADAVLNFRWEETRGERRQRVMSFEKFRGIMPHFEEKDIVKFKVRISAERGFDVESIRVVI